MKIFVSHSGKEKEISEKIDAILARLDIDHWIDLGRIKEGISVRSEIDNGFLNSTHFFLLWSKAASKSRWVNMEIDKAVSGGILKCPCPVCISISAIPPRNEWNTNRRYHYLYVLGKLTNELVNYIDGERMELAISKLTKSALSNFKNMLPLVTED